MLTFLLIITSPSWVCRHSHDPSRQQFYIDKLEATSSRNTKATNRSKASPLSSPLFPLRDPPPTTYNPQQKPKLKLKKKTKVPTTVAASDTRLNSHTPVVLFSVKVIPCTNASTANLCECLISPPPLLLQRRGVSKVRYSSCTPSSVAPAWAVTEGAALFIPSKGQGWQQRPSVISPE